MTIADMTLIMSSITALTTSLGGLAAIILQVLIYLQGRKQAKSGRATDLKLKEVHDIVTGNGHGH